MAYVFENEAIGKARIVDENNVGFTLNGINAREQSADSIMSGLETLLGIVDWTIEDAARIVTQDIVEE